MKKHFILAAMTVAAIFTGCSNEEESLMPNANAPVSFVIDGPVTRTTTSTSGVTSFAEGDEITMYSAGLKADMSGTVFTVGAEGTLTAKEGETFTFNGPNGAAFYAYYPTRATGTTTNATFTVATDQRASGAFNQSDFMTSNKAVNEAQAETISLQFAHRLTLVKVELVGIANVTGVEMNNVQPTATWTYNGDNVTTSGTATTIEMGIFNNEYWAVVPAQTITTGTVLFTIQAGGKTYTYKPIAKDIIFAEGEAKKFKLTIAADGQTVVALSTVITTAWGEDDTINGEISEEIKNYITLPTTDGNITTITNRTNLYQKNTTIDGITTTTPITTSGWGFLNSYNNADNAVSNNGTITVTTQETDPKGNWSWYNRTLYFYNPETLMVGEYTLKIKAKTNTANASVQISLISKNIDTSNCKFSQIAPTTDSKAYTGYLQSISTSETEYTFTINIGNTITSNSTSSKEVTTFDNNEEAFEGFLLAIAFQPETFTLSDIQLIKK